MSTLGGASVQRRPASTCWRVAVGWSFGDHARKADRAGSGLTVDARPGAGLADSDRQASASAGQVVSSKEEVQAVSAGSK